MTKYTREFLAENKIFIKCDTEDEASAVCTKLNIKNLDNRWSEKEKYLRVYKYDDIGDTFYSMDIRGSGIYAHDVLNDYETPEPEKVSIRAEGESDEEVRNKVIHQSGIPAHALCYFKDGDQWCCVFGDFINLQESPAGFGNTQSDALVDLTIQWQK